MTASALLSSQQSLAKPLYALLTNAEGELVRRLHANDLLAHPVECIKGLARRGYWRLLDVPHDHAASIVVGMSGVNAPMAHVEGCVRVDNNRRIIPESRI